MWLRGPTTIVQGINMMYKYKVNITNVGKYMAYSMEEQLKECENKEQLEWNKCVGCINYWHDYSH